MDGRRGWRAVAALQALVAWALVARVSWALLDTDLTWSYVAQQVRREAPWPYRLAGLWGGPRGSLLLFAAIVCTAAWVAARRSVGRIPTVGAIATGTALLVVDLVVASPFGRLDVPAIAGAGLTPILEHPAMAVHPPVLYAGLAAALVAAARASDGLDPLPALRFVIAATTAAMALGAWWSYAEQGWGGYWAWDPVENTSLLVWLGALAALHAGHLPRLGALPWVLVVAGGAMVRSGRTPSIHGFAEDPAVGWAMVVLAVLSGGWFLGPRRRSAARPAQLPAAILFIVLTVVVAAGTFLPAIAGWIGGRRLSVRGTYFARVVGPLALAGAVLLVITLRRGLVRRGRVMVAHLGMLVLLAGLGAASFDRHERVRVQPGVAARAAGMNVVGGTVQVMPGSRPGTSAVIANVVVDGHLLRPSLVAYPDRGGVLAETAMRARPWSDVQVALISADDNGSAVIDVRWRPLTWLIWAGAALTALAVVPRRRGVDAGARAVR